MRNHIIWIIIILFYRYQKRKQWKETVHIHSTVSELIPTTLAEL